MAPKIIKVEVQHVLSWFTTYLLSDKKGRLAADIFIKGDDFQGIYIYTYHGHI